MEREHYSALVTPAVLGSSLTIFATKFQEYLRVWRNSSLPYCRYSAIRYVKSLLTGGSKMGHIFGYFLQRQNWWKVKNNNGSSSYDT